MRILIADDEPQVLKSVSEFLADFGHQITSVDSGQAALNSVASSPPFDLILSDVRMSPVGGLSLLWNIQKTGGHPPVILMTAYENRKDKDAAQALGARAYLPKPIKLRMLLETIEAIEQNTN